MMPALEILLLLFLAGGARDVACMFTIVLSEPTTAIALTLLEMCGKHGATEVDWNFHREFRVPSSPSTILSVKSMRSASCTARESPSLHNFHAQRSRRIYPESIGSYRA